MKKNKFLTLVIAAAIMMMGAAYAAWTDQLQITNTISTGYLDVVVAQENGTVAVYASAEDAVQNKVDGLTRTATAVRDTEDANNKTAKVTIDNLYPGAVARIAVPFINDGSIPVVMDGIGDIVFNTPANDISVVEGSIKISTQGAIAKGGSGTVTFDITVGDNAQQNTETTFTVPLTFKQFND